MKDTSLAVLADAYTSPLLLNALVRLEIPTLPLTEGMGDDLASHCQGLSLIDQEAAVKIIANPDSHVLTNAGIGLPFLIEPPADPARVDGITLFRDRARFRRQTADAFPEIFFAEVGADELEGLKLPPGRDYIIKPALGLEGIGLRMIRGGKGLEEKAAEALKEAEEASRTLPPGLVSPERFVVEEYISGEEVACDAYFSSRGEPVVLGVYTLPHLKEDDFRDVLYCTSKETIRKMSPRIRDFLKRASRGLRLRGFPLHARFRLKRNRLVPIEVNPMRFGGFGLPDLPFLAFGLNSYRLFFEDGEPDWKRALADVGDETFFMIRSLIAPSARDRTPDHEKYSAAFDDLMGYCKLDPSRYPAFSVAFGRAKDRGEAMKYLSLHFEDYLS